ncbi:unnamed protein product [Brassica oleracea]
MVISPPSLPTPMTQRLQLQPGSSPRRTSLLRDLNPRPPPEPPDPADRVPLHRCCSVFLRSSPKVMSIGTPVVLSRLQVSSTVLFSGESQTMKLVAFHARCITLAGPLPLCFRSVSQTLRSHPQIKWWPRLRRSEEGFLPTGSDLTWENRILLHMVSLASESERIFLDGLNGEIRLKQTLTSQLG